MQDNDNDHDYDHDYDHGKMSQTVAGLNVRILTSRGMTPPTYATAGSAALDLRAAFGEDEEVVIGPGSRVLIPTGIAIAPESTDVVAVVAARSGLAIKSGITLSNGIGVIDSDYRGEICVGLYNTSDKPFVVRRGDRIAQLMFMPVLQARFLEVTSAEELGVTGRGAGGFGSTGIQ